MLDCFGEEETTRVARRRMVVDPGEKIFVQHVKQEERYESKTVDNGSDDGVAECDDNKQGH